MAQYLTNRQPLLGQAKKKSVSTRIGKRGAKRRREERGSTPAEDDFGGDLSELFKKYLESNKQQVVNILLDSAEWTNHEQSVGSMYYDIDILQEENRQMQVKLNVMEGRLTRAEKLIDDLNNRVIDLTTRSMRDNLMFKNFTEEAGETPQQIRKGK